MVTLVDRMDEVATEIRALRAAGRSAEDVGRWLASHCAEALEWASVLGALRHAPNPEVFLDGFTSEGVF